MNVPQGFTEEIRDYKEGIVITLHYPDESVIILQQGGMMQLPLLGTDLAIDSISESRAKSSRRGRSGKSAYFWREDDYKRQPLTKRHVTWLELFPPNICYEHVAPAHKRDFDAALDSFDEPPRMDGPPEFLLFLPCRNSPRRIGRSKRNTRHPQRIRNAALAARTPHRTADRKSGPVAESEWLETREAELLRKRTVAHQGTSTFNWGP